MRPLEPVELTLRCSGKRRVGTDCHWVIRDRAGESVPAWYGRTIVSEIVFHNRMLNHIPFYAGLAVGKYLWSNSTAEDRDLHYGIC
uniref:Uncharacterized protein n=1 Tax=Fagus sylvatica TaxID=28930 RepID=A0A2N9FJD0_FAGSY